MDKKTGTKYKIMNISFHKLMMMRLLLPVSYVLYGLIIAFILEIIGISNQLSLILLAIAYIANIPLSISKNHLSPVEKIHLFLVAPLISSMIVLREPQVKNEMFKDTSSIKEIEKKLKIIRFERLDYESIILSISSQALDLDVKTHE